MRAVTRLGGVLFAIAVSLPACTCRPPTITALDPPQGPPRTVVRVTGTDLLLGQVIWDSGLGSETALPTSLGGNLFSVPPGATAGPHPVAVRTNQGTSAALTFTVTADVPHPAPRIDDLYVDGFGIDGAGKASFLFFAYGPNIDSGAKIVVNDVEQPTWMSQALRVTPPGDPTTLGYPIYHYGMVWTILSDQTPGATINVKVKNLDNVYSAVTPYKIAPDLASLDSDNDGLPDQQEENGFDANNDGTVDVNLPAMGVNKRHKDILLEIDWMTGNSAPQNLWGAATTAMANFPVLNVDGVQGVNLIVDRGQGAPFTGGGTTVPYRDCVRLGGGTDAGNLDVYAFKSVAANFDPNRLRLFHYIIFGYDSAACATGCGTGVTNAGCSSGRSESASGPGNDLYVTCPSTFGSCDANGQAATLLHELGHNLALQHGGNVGTNRKPNYPSIMSYRYQFPGVSTDCNLTADGVLTYSQSVLATLNENSLNEPAGICGNQALDWNGNGNSTETGVQTDINADAARSVLNDNADFQIFQLDFATATGSQWGNN
jgi:hypothetical protein